METSQKRPATRETRPGPLTAWDRRDVRLLLGATALVCGAAGRRLKQAEPLRPHSAPLARQRAIRPLSSVIWTAQSTRGDAFAPKVNSGDAWVPGDQAAKPAALSRPHPLAPRHQQQDADRRKSLIVLRGSQQARSVACGAAASQVRDAAAGTQAPSTQTHAKFALADCDEPMGAPGWYC